MSKALEDILVLDLTRVLAGPYASMCLADFGAKVIKIERPKVGDDSRAFGPFINNESLYFANVNRNKSGITLNLKSEEGKKLFLKMVEKADVVLENYRPGVMDKLGLGYDVLSQVNSRIIYGAVSGFGSYGPYSSLPGYDIIGQAMGGIMSITGQENGSPTRVGSAVGDVLGGMNLVIGILTALHYRDVTGKGQRVDIALTDSIVSAMENTSVRYFASGKLPKRIGNRYESAYPYDSFPAMDGDFVIGCGNDKLYQNFCMKVLNRPELITDERFSSNIQRVKNYEALREIVSAWSTQHTVKEAVSLITAAGVPAASINTIDDVMHDEHIAGVREMVVYMNHPVIGEMPVNGNPVKLMSTPPEVKTPAPTLGQNNEEIFCGLLGIGKMELEELKEQGVI